jgi:hypothetical protein
LIQQKRDPFGSNAADRIAELILLTFKKLRGIRSIGLNGGFKPISVRMVASNQFLMISLFFF